MTSVEVYYNRASNFFGNAMLGAFYSGMKAAGIEATCTDTPTGDADVLVIYGIGAEDRAELYKEHVKARGKIMLSWDIGYWNRMPPESRHWRFSVNGAHPTRDLVNKVDPLGNRYQKSGPPLLKIGNPDGPIILCGIGKKERNARGLRVLEWETNMLKKIKRRFPDRQILFRPKPNTLEVPHGLAAVTDCDIFTAIRGASLVVCLHSNVAVDCIIAGVDCVCEEGIAASVLGNDIEFPIHLTVQERERFLERVSWFQWKATEAYEAAQFIFKEILK
jgi:hypothetical protein